MLEWTSISINGRSIVDMYSIYKSATTRVCILVVCLLLLSFNYAQAAGDASVREINTAGGGKVTLRVLNFSNGQEAADGIIRWSGTEAGSGWKLAEQCIEVEYENLPQYWGVQIYTDNKNGNPAYPAGAKGDPAGLISISPDYRSLPLSMAWRVLDKSPDQINSDDPDMVKLKDELLNPVYEPTGHGPDEKYPGFKSFAWHFLKDKETKDDSSTTDLDEGFYSGDDYTKLDYQTVWNPSGIAWNEGGRAHNPKKAYIYLATNFTMAKIGAEYKTTTLTLEAYKGISPFPLYIYKDAPLTMHPDEEGATLENHYAPALMNYNNKPSEPNIIMDDKYAENPHSGGHSLKIRWTGEDMPGKGAWAGVMWLEPEQEWTGGPDKGYDLRGVTHLGFWVRSDNPGASLNVFFGLDGDSCQRTPPYDLWIPLTTEWTYHIIPLLLSGTEDMSYVAGGFGIVFNEGHDGQAGSPGYTVYLDDIKFETGL